MDKLKIVAVECDDGRIFISENPHNYNTGFQYLFFNGKHSEESFCERWFIIKEKPKKIEREISQPDINHRYELIDKSMQSKKVPLVFSREDVSEYDSDECQWIWKEEFAHLCSLYKPASDKQPLKKEEIDFDFVVLMKVGKIPDPTKFSYSVGEKYLTITERGIKHQLIDELIFPKLLLPQRPCQLSSEQTYQIVRQYVKQHINLEVAEITSDYNFCFTVKKKIPLSEPEKYQVNLNWATKRRPKMVTRYRSKRLVECFEMTYSPENYKGYTPIQGFEGKTQEDLKNKIDTYCKGLIDFINIPLRDCPHCKGLGVVEKER